MGQVFQDLQPLLHDQMRLVPFDVDDKADPARIFLDAEDRIALALGGSPGIFMARILV